METEEKSASELLARRNLQNIAAKLKAGKTLTTSERKALNEFQAEQTGGWVKDLSALAKELGMSRQAIYDVRNRFSDAPKKHEDGKRENLAAWQQFCAEHLIGKDVATKTLSDLKAELMREQIELARAKNKREAASVIDLEAVESGMATLSQKLYLLLKLKLTVELGPRGVGKSAAELNLEGESILEEISEVVRGNIARFETDVIKQTASLDDAE
jgi:hypothetical protein